MNQHFRSRPQTDHLTLGGATNLANVIRLYWAAKGKFPNLTLEKVQVKGVGRREGLGDGIYCIKSDMLGGWPI